MPHGRDVELELDHLVASRPSGYRRGQDPAATSRSGARLARRHRHRGPRCGARRASVETAGGGRYVTRDGGGVDGGAGTAAELPVETTSMDTGDTGASLRGA